MGSWESLSERSTVCSGAAVLPGTRSGDALLGAHNPHTVGTGLDWVDLVVLVGWGVAGLVVAIRRFSWMPRGT